MKRIFLTFFICLVPSSLFAMQECDAQYTIVCAQEIKQHLDAVSRNCSLAAQELRKNLEAVNFEQKSPESRTKLLEKARNSSWAAQEVMGRWYYALGNNRLTNNAGDYVDARMAPIYVDFNVKFLSRVNVFCGGASALPVISQSLDQAFCVNKMSNDQFYLCLMGLLASIEKLKKSSGDIIIALADFCGEIAQYTTGK